MHSLSSHPAAGSLICNEESHKYGFGINKGLTQLLQSWIQVSEKVLGYLGGYNLMWCQLTGIEHGDYIVNNSILKLKVAE